MGDVMKIDGMLLRKVLTDSPLAEKKAIEDARVVDKESVSLSVKKGNFTEDESADEAA